MKKILQIPNYLYPHIGGIEQVAKDIANALCGKAEIQQKIICFNEDAEDGDYICRRTETVKDMVNDVEVIRCGCITKISSQSISMTYPKELWKILKEFNPDIVILHYPNPFVTFFLLRMIKRETKLIVYWHLDITKQKILGKLFHRQNLKLIRRADKIIGATPNHIEESAYTKYFKNKKEILPYMIDENMLKISQDEVKAAEKIRVKYEGKTIGFFIGRHVPYKGLEYLIEASRLLDKANIHFLIAGSGELTDELKTQAAGDHKIEFLGRISDSEKRIYLQACHIFCFPSITRNEGFGLALAEGMFFGKPAVTFKIFGSGVNYVNLDGVTGIECPNGNAKAYADALLKLVNDDELQKKYGENARQRVLNNFEKQQFEQNVYRIVSEI